MAQKHPSTTLLQDNTRFRNVKAGINRYWGGIGAFRKELGVIQKFTKPAPKTKKRKIMVLKMLRRYGAISYRDICKSLKISYNTAVSLVRDMVYDGTVNVMTSTLPASITGTGV